jgi:pilus assembly protein CpaF
MSLSDMSTSNLGPLEAILSDPEVSEVLIDGPDRIYVERRGKLEDVDARFDSADHLLQVIRAILAPLGQGIDESHPIVDARLFDGTLMTAIIPPICLNGPAMTLRKFKDEQFTFEDLIRFGSLNDSMVQFLRACVIGGVSMIVSGNTGSGKTTVMNLIASMIPPDERIITIERVSELRLRQRRRVTLEARPPNLSGRGEVSMADLVTAALKLRPERLIVGELNGAEIWPLLHALNAGHDGSMSLIHANSPRDALARMEIMATSAEPSIPLLNVREQMASALSLIVQTQRLANGRRKITHITEVQRLERETIALQDIFVFVEGSGDSASQSAGHFRATGHVPSFLPALRQRGAELSLDLFSAP